MGKFKSQSVSVKKKKKNVIRWLNPNIGTVDEKRKKH